MADAGKAWLTKGSKAKPEVPEQDWDKGGSRESSDDAAGVKDEPCEGSKSDQPHWGAKARPRFNDTKRSFPQSSDMCSELLPSPSSLESSRFSRDLSNLRRRTSPYGVLASTARQIVHYFTVDVRPAFQYWIYHLEQSGSRFTDQNSVYVFLLEAFPILARDVKSDETDSGGYSFTSSFRRMSKGVSLISLGVHIC